MPMPEMPELPEVQVRVLKIIVDVYVVAEEDHQVRLDLMQYSLDMREQFKESVHDAVKDLLQAATGTVPPNIPIGADFHVLTEEEYIYRARKKPPKREERREPR